MHSMYLEQILDSQKLDVLDIQKLHNHQREVEAFLRDKFGQNPNDPLIKIAGSVAKGTAIKDSYDLDLVVYFPSSDNRNLKEIHRDVWDKLLTKYTVEPKASALRIKQDQADYHIDVVPGRFIANPPKDAFLYVTYGEKERMQTNLKRHIEYITNSGCIDTIKLVKIWKVRNGLTLKTFILELFVIKALEGYSHKDNLESSFKKVMESMRDNLRISLIDPANTNNVVSATLSESEKSVLSLRASETVEVLERNGKDKWSLIFKELSPGEKMKATTIINRAPAGQWSTNK